ncbi:tumor necrosis factor ligand superfamily member 10-like [Lampetra fluviatilis]
MASKSTWSDASFVESGVSGRNNSTSSSTSSTSSDGSGSDLPLVSIKSVACTTTATTSATTTTTKRLVVVALTLVLLQLLATAGFVGYFTLSLQKVRQESATKLQKCLTLTDSDDLLCQEFLYYMDNHIAKKSREIMSSQLGDPIAASSSNPASPLGGLGHAASRKRPIAHVTGKQPREATVTQLREGEHLQRLLGAQSGKVLYSWEEKLGSVHVQHMDFTGATLTARQHGSYYVYAQTYFRFSTRQGDAHRGGHEASGPASDLSARQRQVQTMVLYLYKRTDHYPKPLLLAKAAQTKCWSASAQYGLHSVQLGGVFSLRRGDQLFIAVSDPTLVDFDPEASFFGSFLLE